MENASKALLIAGAILIAILLIGIAMMVFGNINGITGMAGQQVDALEIQGFNRQFEQYEGENVSGSNVKTLISNINASNATYADDTSKQIDAGTGSNNVVSSTGTSPKVLSGTIGTNYRYKVTFGKDASGFINSVTITRVTN